MDHIYINELKLIKKYKEGCKTKYLLDNNNIISTKDIKIVETECPDCKIKRRISKLHHYNLVKATVCDKCRSVGDRNPFYGKTHTSDFIKKRSIAMMGKYSGDKNPMYGKTVFSRWVELYGEKRAQELEQNKNYKVSLATSGDKNPFYGKTHTKESIDIIVSKNKTWRDNLTEEEKKIISNNISLAQKACEARDPELYRRQKQKAAGISAQQSHRYKINSIEKIVQIMLEKSGLDFEYSVIMGFFQFDFGNKKNRILLEVQGDYWHGNPEIYQNFNSIQIANKQKDIIKKEFAEKHGFKLFYIWENEIKNNDFSVIQEMQKCVMS